MRDYTCTVAGKSVIVREDWQDRAAVPVARPPLPAVAPSSPGRGAPIEPGEDAAELPARPRFSHVLALFVKKRLLDRKRPVRQIEAVLESGKLFQEATADPFFDALEESTLLRYLEFLEARTWRGKLLRPRTIRKHFANLGELFQYAGPRLRTGKIKRTACRCGLYGLDPETGRPREAPGLCADDLPAATAKRKPTLSLAQIAQWIDACAVVTQPVIAGVSTGIWLACLITFARHTAARIESILLAEWDKLDGHWLTLPAEIVKGKKCEQEIYVNSWALAAARQVRTSDPRIFSWRHTERYFLSCIREAFADQPAFRMHRLRATFITELLGEKQQIVAQCQVAHKGGVTKESYAEFKRIAPKVLEDAKVLPQPRPRIVTLPDRVFIRPEDATGQDDQLRLF